MKYELQRAQCIRNLRAFASAERTPLPTLAPQKELFTMRPAQNSAPRKPDAEIFVDTNRTHRLKSRLTDCAHSQKLEPCHIRGQ